MRLSEVYEGLEILYNDRIEAGIGLELDIYIPSLSLAFELNGPAHYGPIYGPDALKKTQKRDETKRVACQEKGIKLLVMDVSAMSRFKHPDLEKHTRFVLTEVQRQIETLQG